MIELAANAIILLTSFYFMILGVAAFVSPKLVGKFLLGFAKTRARHYTELAVRLVVGASFVAVASSMPYPLLFKILGWVLLGTTALMIFLPWKVHDNIARRSVPKALAYLPLIGVASLALGGLIIASIWRGYAA